METASSSSSADNTKDLTPSSLNVFDLMEDDDVEVVDINHNVETDRDSRNKMITLEKKCVDLKLRVGIKIKSNVWKMGYFMQPYLTKKAKGYIEKSKCFCRLITIAYA